MRPLHYRYLRIALQNSSSMNSYNSCDDNADDILYMLNYLYVLLLMSSIFIIHMRTIIVYTTHAHTTHAHTHTPTHTHTAHPHITHSYYSNQYALYSVEVASLLTCSITSIHMRTYGVHCKHMFMCICMCVYVCVHKLVT